MELKLFNSPDFERLYLAFNRTRMELKLVNLTIFTRDAKSFNRTRMELKQWEKNVSWAAFTTLDLVKKVDTKIS